MVADPWIPRLAVVFAGVVAVGTGVSCAVLSANGHEPPQVLVVIATASVTQLGNLIAALYPRQGEQRQHGGNG